MAGSTVTLQDLVRETGLSIATVSRGINHTGYISDESRQILEQAMKKLNYTPRRVVSKKRLESRQILLSLPDYGLFYYGMIPEVVKMCDDNGLSLVLSFYSKDTDKQLKTIRNLKNKFVDGMIMFSIDANEELFGALNVLPIPTVLCGYHSYNFSTTQKNFDYIAIDTRNGLFISTNAMISAGCKNISYVGMSLNSQTGRERYSGYKYAMSQSGLKINDSDTFLGDDYEQLGYQAGCYYAEHTIPDAVVTANDTIVLGLLTAFKEHRVAVPERVKIIGMDNTFIGQKVSPTISTVDLYPVELGHKCMKALLSRLKNPDAAYIETVLQPKLILRESSGFDENDEVSLWPVSGAGRFL